MMPPGRPTPPGEEQSGKHPLSDPLGFPLEFKQWVVAYVTQELQLQKVLGFEANPVLVTGIIPSTGTTPTAGTGFTYTHTNTSGIYVFTFVTSFVATPTVVATPQTASRPLIVSAASASGFTVTASGGDSAFMFIAHATA